MKHLIYFLCLALLAWNCDHSGSGAKTADSLTTTDHTSISDVNAGSHSDTASNFTAINETDREFLIKTAMGNTAEVEAGMLAQQRGNSTAVKDFGAMMVKDHGEAQEKLKIIGGRLAISVLDSVDAAHKDLKDRLSALTGAKFDEEYIRAQVKDHKETILLFEKEIAHGSNSELKQFATTTLPHIRMHLQKAENISGVTHK